MKRSAIKETVIKREIREAEGATYSYALIMSESKKVASYKIPLYSIGIEMVDAYGNETSAQTSDLFADVGKATVVIVCNVAAIAIIKVAKIRASREAH